MKSNEYETWLLTFTGNGDEPPQRKNPQQLELISYMFEELSLLLVANKVKSFHGVNIKIVNIEAMALKLKIFHLELINILIL